MPWHYSHCNCCMHSLQLQSGSSSRELWKTRTCTSTGMKPDTILKLLSCIVSFPSLPAFVTQTLNNSDSRMYSGEYSMFLETGHRVITHLHIHVIMCHRCSDQLFHVCVSSYADGAPQKHLLHLQRTCGLIWRVVHLTYGLAKNFSANCGGLIAEL